MDITRDFVAGRHGYSLVAAGGRIGGADERTTEIKGVLRAVDECFGPGTSGKDQMKLD
jgi:hypothetical protein